MKQIFKGVMWAVIITLVFVVTFAFLVNIFGWGDGIIKPIIQVVKILSIFFGVGIALKDNGRVGWLIGLTVGALYIVFAFCIFSAVDGKFALDMSALNDAIFSIVIGILSAFIFRGRQSKISV
jgi:putative membrane protein (TIGR04086 family)